MLEPIQYTTKQETMKQVCSTERAWMELLPQMGNFNWGPIWRNNIVTRVYTVRSDLSVRKFRNIMVPFRLYTIDFTHVQYAVVDIEETR